MSENPNSKDDFTSKLENSINMTIIEELKDINNPDILVSHLRNLNKIYEDNLEKQHFFKSTQSLLNEEASLVLKKIKTIEEKITKKKEELNENKTRLNHKEKQRRSFFESLQQDNEKEIILKKNSILTEEIENLELSKKQSDNSNHNFSNLTTIDFDKKKSDIIILITKILELLKNEKLENISRYNYLIIDKSIEISEFTIPE